MWVGRWQRRQRLCLCSVFWPVKIWIISSVDFLKSEPSQISGRPGQGASQQQEEPYLRPGAPGRNKPDTYDIPHYYIEPYGKAWTSSKPKTTTSPVPWDPDSAILRTISPAECRLGGGGQTIPEVIPVKCHDAQVEHRIPENTPESTTDTQGPLRGASKW